MSELELHLTPLSAELAARLLLGARLIRRFDDGQVAEVKIVETEAYDQDDPASHTFIGQTLRNAVMFGPAGRAYVYRSYGLHWCFNVTVGPDGFGAGVLIRAAEPLRGLNIMQANRPSATGVGITNGPAKLTQALLIDGSFNHHDLSLPPLRIQLQPIVSEQDVVATRRIGITKATDSLRRYYLKNSAFISKV